MLNMLPPSGVRTVSRSLEEKIMRQYVSTINRHIKKTTPKIKKRLSDLVFGAIFNCPEMNSLRGGKLKFDLGVVKDPTNQIAEAVADSIDITFSKFVYTSSGINGSASVNIQPDDNLNLLSLPEATYITEKGETIPWLDWLLHYGDSVIILNYGVTYGPGGRTGGAIMTKTLNAPFQIDSAYSGTSKDNFVVRALSKLKGNIEREIWRTIRN